MDEFVEVKIKIKDDSFRTEEKHAIYTNEGFNVSRNNTKLQEWVGKALEGFSGDPANCDVSIFVRMEW
jgi:hypothetical protein